MASIDNAMVRAPRAMELHQLAANRVTPAWRSSATARAPDWTAIISTPLPKRFERAMSLALRVK